ncbi:hypothetical protein JOC37_002289 [Desulfohalotomaculum tongense]|uniref:hypothetical protein n=1 Tax=Desulforadius tongensis TaxID=1216062 RepID=UPI00195F2192|nr:hypothetical protein [Desulforadius tongensis]MBM7855868.1 hypothetical protein [Desulforadius tongensis]
MEGINPQEQGLREDGKDNPTYPAPTEKAVGNSLRFQTQEENTGINNHAFQEPGQNTRQNSFSLRASGQIAGESNLAFQVDGGGAGGSNPPAWEPYKNNGEINPPGPEPTGVIPKEVHPAILNLFLVKVEIVLDLIGIANSLVLAARSYLNPGILIIGAKMF